MYFQGKDSPVGTWSWKCWTLQACVAFILLNSKGHRKEAVSAWSPLFYLEAIWHVVCSMKMMCLFHAVPTARRCWCSSAAISHLGLLAAGGKERNNVPVRLLKQVTWKTAVYLVQGSKMIIHQGWTKNAWDGPKGAVQGYVLSKHGSWQE